MAARSSILGEYAIPESSPTAYHDRFRCCVLANAASMLSTDSIRCEFGFDPESVLDRYLRRTPPALVMAHRPAWAALIRVPLESPPSNNTKRASERLMSAASSSAER